MPGEMEANESAPQILLVDDDRALIDVLSMALEDVGFDVRTAANGKLGWEALQEKRPDLVVLDLLMPELDGLQVCKLIRAKYTVPIVMLTSRDQEMDKILGLEMGADDYVTKPFSTRELIARLRAALRRPTMHVAEPIADALRSVGSLRLDQTRRKIWFSDTEVVLTATEFDVLWILTENPGHVCSRSQLREQVYGNDCVVEDRTIDTFVKRLRRKLSNVDPAFSEIETVRAVGYRYGE